MATIKEIRARVKAGETFNVVLQDGSCMDAETFLYLLANAPIREPVEYTQAMKGYRAECAKLDREIGLELLARRWRS